MEFERRDFDMPLRNTSLAFSKTISHGGELNELTNQDAQRSSKISVLIKTRNLTPILGIVGAGSLKRVPGSK